MHIVNDRAVKSGAGCALRATLRQQHSFHFGRWCVHCGREQAMNCAITVFPSVARRQDRHSGLAQLWKGKARRRYLLSGNLPEKEKSYLS